LPLPEEGVEAVSRIGLQRADENLAIFGMSGKNRRAQKSPAFEGGAFY
jgi:hypothetical protein